MPDTQKKLRVGAVEGRTVVLPGGKPWPMKAVKRGGKDVTVPDVLEVETSLFWRRRLADGDVIDMDAAPEAAAADKKTGKAGAEGDK